MNAYAPETTPFSLTDYLGFNNYSQVDADILMKPIRQFEIGTEVKRRNGTRVYKITAFSESGLYMQLDDKEKWYFIDDWTFAHPDVYKIKSDPNEKRYVVKYEKKEGDAWYAGIASFSDEVAKQKFESKIAADENYRIRT